MDVIVVKRDGTKVPFDISRIANAIYKAAESVGFGNQIKAYKLAYQVAEAMDVGLFENNDTAQTQTHEEWTVEEIQDLVEQTLIEHGYTRIAKSYILYRQRRTDVRDLNSKLNKTISDIIYKDASEMDDKRENANINGDTTSGGMLKVGGTVLKDFVLRNCMKPVHADMHRRGEIHYHDMDYAALTFNCIQLPIDKLLDGGFNTGHGTIRTPSTIGSASTLTCIIIQSNQNEMFQSYGTFM